MKLKLANIQQIISLFNKKPIPLTDLLSKDNSLLTDLIIKRFGLTEIENEEENNIYKGIYAFWWLDRKKYKMFEKKLQLIGPNKKCVEIMLSFEKSLLSEFEKNNKFPLYIGKSTNFIKRISLHLRTKTIKWKKRKRDKRLRWSKNKINKIDTSCQLRAGMEFIFLNNETTNYTFFDEYILKNIGITFLQIENNYGKNDEGVKHRFYLEDLAVGIYKPIFNVDSER